MTSLVYGSCRVPVATAVGHRLIATYVLSTQVAVEDVVAGVAAVVAAGRGVVVGPRLTESRSAIVVSAHPQRDLGDAGQHVDSRGDRGHVGVGDELRPPRAAS